MEKRNKQKFTEFLQQNGNIESIIDNENWETTQRGKHFNILIPSEILELKITTNEKIVLGFIYSLNNIGHITTMSNKRIAEYLCLSENTISTTLKSLQQLTFIEKQPKGYVLSEEVQQSVNSSKERSILLFFEVFHSKLPSGAKLLWGEYNSLSKGEKVYFGSRKYVSGRLRISESSISNYTTLLYDNQFLIKNELFSGYKFKKRSVVTKKFDRKPID
ncbi:helix-turn-helix domain-containing protein [Flavobacterium taihuense]|uniref:Helix-turn-helix domain-containing protein n=1 Tax=Flavobacterium taihuense TaxID=2857508 RepID=A0ABS6XVG6_9FLAO|nr:helix-turn-helix domain-containing protein [Flavobacterium taihuense]MBW4360660.1 helix-turn-helix domain-containing protein [Flavobacterium taihuense]